MPFKLNISEKGKAWKVETESEFLVGKPLGEKISGKEIKPELEGYELEITGASDLAGFPHSKNVEGLGLKKVMLKKGFAMHNKKEGLRLRKTLRGKLISPSTVQINFNVVKSGTRPLNEIFPEQNQPKPAKPSKTPVPVPVA